MYKKQGKVINLENFAEGKNTSGHAGIAHTRWAAHGVPNDVNAHPHFANGEDLAIIHNGIIENYETLKLELINRGYTFSSDTDTEVLIQLIKDIQKTEGVSLPEAVRLALLNVTGAYAIVVMSKDMPNTLVAARKSSPLVVGIGKRRRFFILLLMQHLSLSTPTEWFILKMKKSPWWT